MTWDHLSINKPHVAYIILGGFTSLFMLVSLFVKEKLYIGEATVATICGVIFGPHAANLFNPASWGNVDQITLEFSRIVLVVQCFAVGVELPSYYMEKHWRSVVFLLVPVMTFGWLITSLFIWWMVRPLSWLESLTCAACVTATDPVLASSVVGKGKFAKRVPRHLRDLLSAESGCNDGMAFPFIYLALYLIRYKPDVNAVAYHWIVYTILYECIFGAFYGVAIGYAGRHAIKWAERHSMVDRESFLVFYFTLALFCAGSGSLLGVDDLLVGFAAGVGFSNDGWFQAKTEESHVSNVIDLLLNLAYFVYFGAIIPWAQYNMPALGLTPWRLVVIAVFVILFRRIPVMMALKPFVPDIKTWREAIFAGHFGPIGVGAIFVAILARADLETDSTTPLAELPPPGTPNYSLITLIWPIVTFLVISSILVHGSSIAVFTLGKRINTLTLTMSYTQANEEGPSWMNRLPRIQSTAKTSMSFRRTDTDGDSPLEKMPEYPPGTLPPTGVPGNFLRRQHEEDNPSRQGSRASSMKPSQRKKRWDAGMGPGGPISQSAIAPQKRPQQPSNESPDGSETLNERNGGSDEPEPTRLPEGTEVYEEGSEIIVENEDGDVLEQRHEQPSPGAQEKEKAAEQELQDDLRHPSHAYRNLKRRFGEWDWHRRKDGESSRGKPQEQKRGPAMAYQIGNTIIVEDENGEVVKKYDLPNPNKRPDGPKRAHSFLPDESKTLQRVSTWVGMSKKNSGGDGEASSAQDATNATSATSSSSKPKKKQRPEEIDDPRIRFVQGGRRMTEADFIKQIQELDPKARVEAVNESNAPQDVKQAARQRVDGAGRRSDRRSSVADTSGPSAAVPDSQPAAADLSAQIRKLNSAEDPPRGPEGLTLVDSEERQIPYHAVGDDLRRHGGLTAAQQRRQKAMATSVAAAGRASSSRNDRPVVSSASEESDSEDDGTERVPPSKRPQLQQVVSATRGEHQEEETAAERRRRNAALGLDGGDREGEGNGKGREREEDSEDDDTPRENRKAVQEPGVGEGEGESSVTRSSAAGGNAAGGGRIRFADQMLDRGRRK